ncbi:MAG: hypothetical protein O3A51_02875 [Verrucomicrobia bacterium]|nr:hypothetical protein [Verrucomicrobiota bacterium]
MRKKALSRVDRVNYLANVLSIAHADGEMTRKEGLAVVDIAERIGADEHDLDSAKRLLNGGDYGLRLLQDPARRLDNVQDMVMVALADGTPQEIETGPVEKMAGILKFSQADMDMIVKRAEADVHRVLRASQRDAQASRSPFDSLGSQGDDAAKDIPMPALPELTTLPPLQTAMPATPPPIKPKQATKSFRQDREASDAARAARANQRAVVEAPEPAPAPQGLTLAACMAAHDQSDEPRTYCFGGGSGTCNPWGCRFAGMNWEPGAAWLRQGTFRDDTTFVFDKEAIRETLSTNVAPARECPHLREAYMDAALRALPSRASTLGRWRYRPARSSEEGARSVTMLETIHGIAVASQAVVNGLDPVGIRDAEIVIQRASNRAGTEAPELGVLRHGVGA